MEHIDIYQTIEFLRGKTGNGRDVQGLNCQIVSLMQVET